MNKLKNDLINQERNEGSGWVFQNTLSLEMKTARYNPLKGSSYFDCVPNKIKHNKMAGVINIQKKIKNVSYGVF